MLVTWERSFLDVMAEGTAETPIDDSWPIFSSIVFRFTSSLPSDLCGEPWLLLLLLWRRPNLNFYPELDRFFLRDRMVGCGEEATGTVATDSFGGPLPFGVGVIYGAKLFYSSRILIVFSFVVATATDSAATVELYYV